MQKGRDRRRGVDGGLATCHPATCSALKNEDQEECIPATPEPEARLWYQHMPAGRELK